jgi:methionyl-tRNA synthetase
MKPRDFIKYIRDKAKSAYEKGDRCEICGDEYDLDLHHFASLTDLFTMWCRKNKKRVLTIDDVIEVRDEFIEANHKELYEDVATLCHKHHLALHSLFGKTPALPTVKAQRKWIDVQINKNS